MADGWRRFAAHSWSMTGDFLPRRRQASVRIQVLTVVLLIAAAALAIFLLS